jgi:hypothetical protein
MHLHHIGSQTESPVIVPEEPEEQPEVQPQRGDQSRQGGR